MMSLYSAGPVAREAVNFSKSLISPEINSTVRRVLSILESPSFSPYSSTFISLPAFRV